MLGWKQIPINIGEYFLEVTVPPKKEVILPGNFTMLSEKGVHDLVTILIENPFTTRGYSRNVESSIRVGLTNEMTHGEGVSY